MKGKQIAIAIVFIDLLVGTIVLGYIDKSTAMWGNVLAAGVALTFLHLEQIRRFSLKATGLDLEMQETIQKANATIAQLRQIGNGLAVISVYLLRRSGYLDIASDPEKIEYWRHIKSVTSELDIDTPELRRENEQFQETYKDQLG